MAVHRFLLLVFLLIVFGAESAPAQGAPLIPDVDARGPRIDAWTSSGAVFAASAVVPGAGQWLLDAERWVPYAALEAWGWVYFVQQRSEGRRTEQQYRDLAWSVARRISVGPRQDGDFEYYESLTEYEASGAFDLDPRRPGMQPETDTTTYNGTIWSLARALYIPADGDTASPESAGYQQALEYYRAHAISPELAWAWTDNALQQQAFAVLIRRSDEALRAAARALGLVLANHVISAIDALITARLRAAGASAESVGFRSSIEPHGSGLVWTATVRVAWPRR